MKKIKVYLSALILGSCSVDSMNDTTQSLLSNPFVESMRKNNGPQTKTTDSKLKFYTMECMIDEETRTLSFTGIKQSDQSKNLNSSNYIIAFIKELIHSKWCKGLVGSFFTFLIPTGVYHTMELYSKYFSPRK